ncbi:MAG: PLP-dependent aminotransferase family protein [Saprospiraceae bacterium]
MLPWKTIIQIERQAIVPVYLQIANAVIREISQGRLEPGQKIPGSRQMAGLLDLNRKTVSNAYSELEGQGWLEVRPSSGVFVVSSLPTVQYQNIGIANNGPVQKVDLEFNHFKSIEPYRKLEKYQHMIDDGSPDVRLAPLNTLMKYCRSVANSRYGKKLLSYDDVQGEATLRTVLSQYLRETRGMDCKPENIVITRGSQMGIYLVFNMLISKGDKVVVGNPNYDAANWVMQTAGAELEEIPVDKEGISIDALKDRCSEFDIKATYITPHHHFPTTVTLNAQRRMELLELAEQHRFAIVEDDYDYDFHYNSAPILPLASVDKKGLVIYIGSFSKLLAPSVRVGYIVAPEEMVAEINKLRRIVDRQGDPITERAIAEMLKDGEVQRHLKKAVKVYRERRDIFCDILEKDFADHFDFQRPEGGMAVWVHFKKKIEDKVFFEKCKEFGLYKNVDREFLKKCGALRMGFASLNEKEIKGALGVLKSVMESLV